MGADRDVYGEPTRVVEVPLCFQLRFAGSRDADIREVTCPDGEPLQVAPPPPQLPDDDTLRDLLSATGADSQAVEEAIDALGLDPAPYVDIRATGERLGVALLSVEPQSASRSCVLARITGTVVEVWRPSWAQVQPGELSCSADDALAGHGQRAEH